MPAAKKPKKERQALKQAFDLDALIERINLKFGVGSIVLASKAVNLGIDFISSGCYAFDFATGGGIPQNRITQLVGAFSSGKTTLSLKAIIEFQKKYANGFAFVIDVENALDLIYAKRLGVEMSRLFVIRPDSGEQAVDILLEMLKQDIPIMGVVDSIPALVPFAEIDVSLDQQFMGTHARLINRMVKLITQRLKRSYVDADAPPTTVILLNQIREKIGVMFGDPETTPGGRGKDFFAGLTVKLRAGDKIHEDIENNGVKKKVLVGRFFHANVTKNKCGGRPFEEAEWKYWLKTRVGHVFGTYDNEKVLLEFGLFHNIIKLKAQKKGKPIMTYTSKFGDISYAADSAFLKALVDKPKIARSLYRAVMKAVHAENSGLEETPATEPETIVEAVNA